MATLSASGRFSEPWNIATLASDTITVPPMIATRREHLHRGVHQAHGLGGDGLAARASTRSTASTVIASATASCIT